MRIDAKLSFEKQIKQIYAKARAELKGLAIISLLMNTYKKTFFTGQFS